MLNNFTRFKNMQQQYEMTLSKNRTRLIKCKIFSDSYLVKVAYNTDKLKKLSTMMKFSKKKRKKEEKNIVPSFLQNIFKYNKINSTRIEDIYIDEHEIFNRLHKYIYS